MANRQTLPTAPPHQQLPIGEYHPAPAQTDVFLPRGHGQLPSYGYSATAQPTPMITTYRTSPEKDYSGMAECAVIFSTLTLILCGASIIALCCSYPAFVLSAIAMWSRGRAQRDYAGISIGLNVIVVICTLLFLIIFIPAYVVGGARST